MKKMMTYFLITLLLMNNCSFVNAGVWGSSDSEIRITVNGEQVVSDTAPFIESGRTYVPVRAVLEAYGVDSIEWQAPYVVVKDGGTTLRIPVLESHIEKNGDWIVTDTPALIKNGRTCLPIRAVIEALGGRVTWEAGSRTVVIASMTPMDTLKEGNMRIICSGLQGIEHAEFNSSGNLVRISYVEGRVAVWNSVDGTLRELGGAESTGIVQTRFSSDGNKITSIDEKGTIKQWNGVTGALISQLSLNYPEELWPAEDISTDGGIVISNVSEEKMAVINVKTGDFIAQLELKDVYPDVIQLSQDAKKVMIISYNGCSVWDTATGVIESNFGSDLNKALFSPDGKRVFTITIDGVAAIWDAASGQKHAEATLEKGYENWVEFSPDGKRVAIAIGKTIYLLDATTLKVLNRISGHASDVQMIRFDTAGERLVSAASDGTARVWDANTGKPIAVLEGHSNTVESAVLSPDWKTVLTASNDGTVRIWSVDHYAKLLEAPVVKNTTDEPGGICIVSDVGGFKDGGFNELAFLGLKEAEIKYSTKGYAVESVNEVDYSMKLDTASKQNRSLICAIGFMMADALEDVAKNYPEQQYAIFDENYGENTLPNVTGITFKVNESSFLVGYIAGKMTKTNKVGFVGGVDFSLIREFQYGYTAGVKMANPSCEVISQYAGSFTDSAAGKDIAERMYGQGADIIYHASGATAFGIIEAAQEKGKYVIGVDIDQSVLAPDNVLTSAVKRLDTAVLNVVKEVHDGTLKGGKTVVYGLAEGGVDIAPTTSRLVPAAIMKEVESVRKQIIDGTIKVPNNQEEYEAYIKITNN